MKYKLISSSIVLLYLFNHSAFAQAPISYCDTHSGNCQNAVDLMNSQLWNKVVDTNPPNGEKEAYNSDSRYIQFDNNKSIIITAIKDGDTNHPYTSGRLNTDGYIGTKQFGRHGLIEAEISLPTDTGSWPAFWMMPQSDCSAWPTCGENDIMEWAGTTAWGNNPRAFLSTEHGSDTPNSDYQGKGSGNLVPSNLAATDNLSNPHYYAMEWNLSPDYKSGTLTFYFDGKVFYTYTLGSDARDTAVLKGFYYGKGFHPILNLAVGGSLGGDISHTPNTMTMTVYNIHMYSLKNNS
ncbi:glycoside hydrolase family 16 protein [Thiotrichales bacterium 19S3-7]|nr:glycoside hydrolase family 16 protein [Thiotrichales bacterium 19S3-7]MCF6801489.1 glycoside hydrolase family 16 protein [Thiotrichales bacterium 19S3-11]